MESTKKKRTWAGYACPVCRFVFRVPKDHRGAGVICPGCDHLLQLPELETAGRNPLSFYPKADAFPPRADASRQGEASTGIVARPISSSDASSDAVPVARNWNAASPVLGQQRVRRKSRSHESKPSWDSESASAKSGEGSSMAMIIGGSLLGLVVVGLGSWLVMGTLGSGENKHSAGSDVNQPGMGGAGDISPVDASVQLTEEEQEVRDEIQESVNTGMDVMVESEKVVRAFLTAESAEDLEGLVRTPEVTVPRMREWYASHQWTTPGAKQVCVGGKVTVKGVMASMSVQMDDYSIKMIALERTADGYLIDWESWVAWSGVDWEDLFKKRPTEAVEVRVICQKDSYYNRLFRDEKKWLAVKMECPDADRLLYGYIESNTTTLTSLVGDLNSGQRIPVTLKVRYPEGSVADNQVVIEEYLQHGWVRPSKSDSAKSAAAKSETSKSADSKTPPKQVIPK